MAVPTGTARSEEPVEACLGGWLKSGDDCPQTHEREISEMRYRLISSCQP